MSGKYGSKIGVKTAPDNLDLGDSSIFKTLKSIDPNYTCATTGTYPVCTSTRAAIMSGKYGSKIGVKTAPDNLDLGDSSIFKT